MTTLRPHNLGPGQRLHRRRNGLVQTLFLSSPRMQWALGVLDGDAVRRALANTQVGTLQQNSCEGYRAAKTGSSVMHFRAVLRDDLIVMCSCRIPGREARVPMR